MIGRRQFLGAAAAIGGPAAAHAAHLRIGSIIDDEIGPLMRAYGIPGMAAAVTTGGARCFRNHGVSSRQDRQPITSETLFEIGSLSKIFTAILACRAQLAGRLSLSGSVSRYLPSLRGSSFDGISLLNLGTYTAGGLPLQVPSGIASEEQLLAYLRNWRPAYAPGTHRTYSNISIGLLGLIAARSLGQPFRRLIERELFPDLGLGGSYIDVPKDRMKDYAQGHTKADAPVRLNPGILAPEAYGVKSCAKDMIRLVEANMIGDRVSAGPRRAMEITRTGYFISGALTQDLAWEQYPYPVKLRRLLAGNSEAMICRTNAASRLVPPLQPQADVLIDKTGATNGFSAYVAFIPARKLGIVMLANRNYPIAPAVGAAFRILTRLGQPGGSSRR